MSSVCDKCGSHLKDGKPKDQGGNKPAGQGLKKEVCDKFKFHGLSRIYGTLVKDVSQTKGTKILNRHYTRRKEFLEDVTTLCTLGIVKDKLIGVITHMDDNNVEFFVAKNDYSGDEERSVLSACELSLKHWMISHVKEQKIGFITVHDSFVPIMQREETSTDVVEKNGDYQDVVDELKGKLVENNADWQIFCVSLSPPLDAAESVDLSEAKEVILGLAQSIIGPNSTVKKVG